MALRYGHRISIDLDLFGQPFAHSKILQSLLEAFDKDIIVESVPGDWAIFSFITKVKVDILPHNDTQLSSIEEFDNIRLFSEPDSIAMKMKAIFGRGTKKDFWDMYEILHRYKLDEVNQFYTQKYPHQELLISVPQALTYFQDAENTPDPISLKNQDWTQVKSFLSKTVREYLA